MEMTLQHNHPSQEANMKKWILLGTLALFIAVSFFFWLPAFLGTDMLTDYPCVIGRLLALVGFILVLFQVVLSSKLKWLERGLGLDKMLGIHKTAGVVGFAFMLSHPVLHASSDILAQGYVTLKWPMILGLVTVLLALVTVGSALLYGKLHLKYGTWKQMHWFNFIIVPVIFGHSLLLGTDLGAQPPLRIFWYFLGGLYLLLLAFILWDRAQVRRHLLQVTDVVQETPDTWSLHFKGNSPEHKPGQFMMLSLLQNGRRAEPHPFTISSSPTSGDLTVSVKAVGDFTSTVKDVTPVDGAIVDMPYGTFSFLNYDAPNLVFIAGGIGVTPFISMLRYMADKKLERNVILIWGNKTEKDIAFKAELEQMAETMPTLRVIHVMSNQPDWTGEKGYVDTGLLHKHLDGFANPQVFVCGPPVMMTKVVSALQQVGVPKDRIHFERFALR
jgi:predicted ferric reductase